jgi:hypothetical protein
METLTDFAFLALVPTCVVMLVLALRHAGSSRRELSIWAVALGLWMGATAALGFSGVLAPSLDSPPPIGLLIVAVFAATLWVTLGPWGRKLSSLPFWMLIGFQVFRLPVELILWALAEQGRGPALLSLEGRNFDILTGLTAPLVAWVVRRKPNKPLVVAWNILGLALVLNVVVHAQLSMPSPFRQIVVEPDPVIVTRFPYVWLPMVLVPMAVAGHLLCLRQVFSRPVETA